MLLVVLSLGPLLVLAAEERQAGEVMADAMTRMMEVMGFGESDSPGEAVGDAMRGRMPMSPDTYGLQGMMPDGAPFGYAWPGNFGNPLWTFGFPEGFDPGDFRPENFRRFGDRAPWAQWRPTTLDGVWEGRDGGLFIVQNYRFRLYKPGYGHIDGMIQQRGDRLALYNPATRTARPYEVAQFRGRLVLRDADGQLLLYRRLWLEQDAATDTLAIPPE